MKICMYCGQPIGDGAAFCPACGRAQAPAARAVPTPQPAAPKKFCRQCGAQMAPGAAFCPACGAPGAAQQPQVRTQAAYIPPAAPAKPKKTGPGLAVNILLGVAALGLVVAGILIIPGKIADATLPYVAFEDGSVTEEALEDYEVLARGRSLFEALPGDWEPAVVHETPSWLYED